MKNRIFTYAAIIMAGMALSSCGGAGEKTKTTEPAFKNGDVPSFCKMKCEFVPDGGEAVIFGKNLTEAKVKFEGGMEVSANENSNDSVLIVSVPAGAQPGALTITNDRGSIVTDSIFRDSRNTIVDFDERFATWGGYEAIDSKGEKISSTMETGQIPVVLPDQISGKYGFLFGKYFEDWTMRFPTYLQYCANPDEGGRGPISVAGQYKDMPLSDLAFKFEVNIPAGAEYVGPKTEIFFGPIDAKDKHGRDKAAICFWTPFAETGSYSTDGWTTITIPLTEFFHGTLSDTEPSKFPLDLNKATNLSFVLFGQVKDKDKIIYMCIDNLRIVPLKK